ncbi:SRPBCC family protein [Micromonospora sp. LZ34]
MSLVVRLERTLDAPPHRVYRAWLEPELLRRWMAPADLVATRVEVDERVGGRYQVWHTDAGTDVGGFDCQLVELVPDVRIVWRWTFVGPERTEGTTYESRLTVTLRPAPGGGTALTLLHERLDALAEAMPHVAENVEDGWTSALDKLAVVAA